MEHSYGITIKRKDTSIKEDDAIGNKVPIPITKDQERLNHCSPPNVNHTPATPINQIIGERAKVEGNDTLAQLMQRATEGAKKQAALHSQEWRRSTNSEPRKPRQSNGIHKAAGAKQSSAEKDKQPSYCSVPFTEDDVCSDEEFIRRSIRLDIYQPEMKRLFWGNGGPKYIELGLLYAQAFDMLKRDKATAIRIKQGVLRINIDEPEYKRAGIVPPGKIFVSGVPTVETLLARYEAEQDQGERDQNEEWLEELKVSAKENLREMVIENIGEENNGGYDNQEVYPIEAGI